MPGKHAGCTAWPSCGKWPAHRRPAAHIPARANPSPAARWPPPGCRPAGRSARRKAPWQSLRLVTARTLTDVDIVVHHRLEPRLTDGRHDLLDRAGVGKSQTERHPLPPRRDRRCRCRPRPKFSWRPCRMTLIPETGAFPCGYGDAGKGHERCR